MIIILGRFALSANVDEAVSDGGSHFSCIARG